ncbi:MAG: TetR/AcrR family transcriptional regulator [Polyangiaceae bacterium]|nr:TetR/AcrR family transcriptional regulator [Polyangiaceae bacterium]
MKRSAAPSAPRDGATAPTTADLRREQLLDAAFALVAERGLEGLRTRDVAARAGVNVATLHYYFASKEDLIVGLVDLVRAKFTARPPIPAGAKPRQELSIRAHLDAAWWVFTSDPRLDSVLLELVSRSSRDPVAREAFRTLHDDWNRIVADELRAAASAGTIRSDLDPIAGARVVTSYIIGARLQLGVNPMAFVPSDVDDELERLLRPAGERQARKGGGAPTARIRTSKSR